MAGKGQKATSQEAASGQRNLQAWVSAHPERGNFKHGANSGIARRRYGDKRYREGKQLASIMAGLISDLGGLGNITSAQRLLLDNIKAKIIVIFQISKYVDLQESIIDSGGNLLPCLGRGFTTYSEALRRDLEALASMGNGKRSRVPSLESIISGEDKT